MITIALIYKLTVYLMPRYFVFSRNKRIPALIVFPGVFGSPFPAINIAVSRGSVNHRRDFHLGDWTGNAEAFVNVNYFICI